MAGGGGCLGERRVGAGGKEGLEGKMGGGGQCEGVDHGDGGGDWGVEAGVE